MHSLLGSYESCIHVHLLVNETSLFNGILCRKLIVAMLPALTDVIEQRDASLLTIVRNYTVILLKQTAIIKLIQRRTSEVS